MKSKAVLLVGLLLISVSLFAQRSAPPTVRVSGVVVDADTKEALPYITIQVEGSMYGTSSDNSGYFSVFVHPGDTLTFSSIGYNRSSFVMPFELSSDQYTLMQLMRKETVLLNELVVFPWPSKQNFEKAFLDTEPKRGMPDLVREVKRDIAQTVEENTKSEYQYDQMRYSRLYELTGQMPPNNFLNPMRWSNFVRDLKSGKISNSKSDVDDED
ncbi:carboxypeptidase-like regulatory domain-containing protein [Fulvivirga ligni]|uniref:carboxypeptidase-like regulatory domain-containing protein n=1 Tax=Fulvivirga ligni TaxID=2904246 RepID=UPI001F2C44FE|nr:carboxypeptidase-like regulatory domain-containing protein [Fulvivirga ligni]UII21117.1 carboxypeptidase-like regulatory domain-containing protein [Fulvivirga ligni]